MSLWCVILVAGPGSPPVIERRKFPLALNPEDNGGGNAISTSDPRTLAAPLYQSREKVNWRVAGAFGRFDVVRRCLTPRFHCPCQSTQLTAVSADVKTSQCVPGFIQCRHGRLRQILPGAPNRTVPGLSSIRIRRWPWVPR
jgi:hypothetical protein